MATDRNGARAHIPNSGDDIHTHTRCVANVHFLPLSELILFFHFVSFITMTDTQSHQMKVYEHRVYWLTGNMLCANVAILRYSHRIIIVVVIRELKPMLHRRCIFVAECRDTSQNHINQLNLQSLASLLQRTHHAKHTHAISSQMAHNFRQNRQS